MTSPTIPTLARAARPLALCSALTFAACGGREAVSVEVPVVVDPARLDPFVTDLGYEIEIVAARTAIADIQFTILGEEHQASARLWDLLVPSAHAHPGHDGNGEVTGELPGTYVVDWVAEDGYLGDATMLIGDYNGANFLFRSADASDGLAADDPLRGHTMHLQLTASRDGETLAVEAILDLDPGNPLIGAPLELELLEDRPTVVALELAPLDPFEGDTAFDGIDFAAIDSVDGVRDNAMVIEPGQPTHNQLRRAFAAHDHYFIDAEFPDNSGAED